MQFDKDLLSNILLYVTSTCSADQVGAVKLHKVLYFADMLSFAQLGTPFFGGTYKKRPYGPTCAELLPTLKTMEREGLIESSTVEYFGHKKKQFSPKAQPKLSHLCKEQTDLLDEVIDFVCRNNSAKSISEFSHNAAWEVAEFGDVLPYSSVFMIFPTDVSDDALDWAEGEGNKIAAEKQGKTSMGAVTYADFRSRVLESC